MKRVGESVLKNYSFLKKITSTKSDKKRKRLLRLATPEELFAIIETAFNLVKSHFKLSPRQRTRLIPHVSVLRKIAATRSQRGVKRIIQSGGGFAALPAILTPILIEAFHLLKNGQ